LRLNSDVVELPPKILELARATRTISDLHQNQFSVRIELIIIIKMDSSSIDSQSTLQGDTTAQTGAIISLQPESDVVASIPTEIEEIHSNFHGAIGGYYGGHRTYELCTLFIIGAFTLVAISILLYHCYKIIKEIRRNKLPVFKLNKPEPTDYVDFEVQTRRQQRDQERQ
jgi:hypothetical protein